MRKTAVVGELKYLSIEVPSSCRLAARGVDLERLLGKLYTNRRARQEPFANFSVFLGAAFASIYGSANAWLISKVRLSQLQTCAVVSAAAFGAVMPSLLVER